ALRRRRWARFIDAEERLRIARGLGRHFLRRPAERPRDGAQDMRQEGGLVAPRPGLRAQVARREVGRVGLEQQPLARDLANQLEQVPAAALVANPAGDADKEAEVEVGAQLFALSREAMGDRVLDLVSLQDVVESGMRIP